jgi:hypothetical protein
MTKKNGPVNEDEAIAIALSYATKHKLGTALEVHEAFYREKIDEKQMQQMESDLGRPMDDCELRLLQQFNKSGWVIQLVFEACPKGATPQGPKVLVDDDGEVSHFRPM